MLRNPPSAGSMVGLFKLMQDDDMHAYIVMRSGDDIREEKLVYFRTKET